MTEIRKIWSEGEIGGKKAYWMGRWNFVMVDVVKNTVETEQPRKYWNDLKKRMKSGPGGPHDWKFQLSERIAIQQNRPWARLKARGKDGKYYLTDVANLETTLRIIQMILNGFPPTMKSSVKIRPGGAHYLRLVTREAQMPGPQAEKQATF